MPEAMHKFVETSVRKAGYGSVSEYVRELIRRDQHLLRREQSSVRVARCEHQHAAIGDPRPHFY